MQKFLSVSVGFFAFLFIFVGGISHVHWPSHQLVLIQCTPRGLNDKTERNGIKFPELIQARRLENVSEILTPIFSLNEEVTLPFQWRETSLNKPKYCKVFKSTLNSLWHPTVMIVFQTSLKEICFQKFRIEINIAFYVEFELRKEAILNLVCYRFRLTGALALIRKYPWSIGELHEK